MHKIIFVFSILINLIAFCASSETMSVRQCDKELIDAAKKLDLEHIRIALQKGANVNAVDLEQQDTPLHCVVGYDQTTMPKHRAAVDAAKELLQAKALVDAKNASLVTPLFYAVCSSNPELVNVLLKANANVNARSNNGGTPICNAASFGSIEVMNILIKALSDVNVKDPHQDTPLHGCVGMFQNDLAPRSIDHIKALLFSGVNYNLLNHNGQNVIAYIQSNYEETDQDRKTLIKIIQDYDQLRTNGLVAIPNIILELQILPVSLARLIAQYCYAFSER